MLVLGISNAEKPLVTLKILEEATVCIIDVLF